MYPLDETSLCCSQSEYRPTLSHQMSKGWGGGVGVGWGGGGGVGEHKARPGLKPRAFCIPRKHSLQYSAGLNLTLSFKMFYFAVQEVRGT